MKLVNIKDDDLKATLWQTFVKIWARPFPLILAASRRCQSGFTSRNVERATARNLAMLTEALAYAAHLLYFLDMMRLVLAHSNLPRKQGEFKGKEPILEK